MHDKKRFEDKFIKKETGCWEWEASLNNKGYGWFRYNGHNQLAHRVSYQLYVGDIPKDKCILHKCNNPKCVNPDHLYVGTHKDNASDMIKAGHHYSPFRDHIYNTSSYLPGEKHSMAKLNVDDVMCIKRMLRDGIQQWLIAWIYKITQANISYINTGKSWSNVTIEEIDVSEIGLAGVLEKIGYKK